MYKIKTLNDDQQWMHLRQICSRSRPSTAINQSWIDRDLRSSHSKPSHSRGILLQNQPQVSVGHLRPVLVNEEQLRVSDLVTRCHSQIHTNTTTVTRQIPCDHDHDHDHGELSHLPKQEIGQSVLAWSSYQNIRICSTESRQWTTETTWAAVDIPG